MYSAYLDMPGTTDKHVMCTNIDELIMCLVGMGFEIEDCQEAIQNGKLTVEAAVEWILYGKSTADTAPLKLGKLANSQFDSSSSLPQNSSTSSMVKASSPCTDQPEMKENTIQSRLHLSDKQQVIKNQFEEKVRMEAQRKAKEEKRLAKEAHAQVLRQIEEDRKKISERQIHIEPNSPIVSSIIETTMQETSGNDSLCKIQVRLPDGNVIRKTYEATTKLNEILSWVKDNVSTMYDLVLIQPYPRKEFSESDYDLTLKELQLFPSGSLVLKGKETLINQETSSIPLENPSGSRRPDLPLHLADDLSDDDEENIVNNIIRGGILPPFLQNLAGDHVWGEGQKLVGNNQLNIPARPVERVLQVIDLPTSSVSATSSHLTLSVPPLEQMCLKLVTKLLCSPVDVLCSLRLPINVAKSLLDILMKQKLLKARMMNAFINCHLRELVLDCYLYVTNDFLHALRYHTNLSHLSLANCTLFNNKGLQSLIALKKLNYLNFSGCKQVTDQCLEIISEFNSLSFLNLENTSVTNHGVINFLVSQSLHLETLILNGTTVTEEIWPALINMPKLRSLSIDQTQVKNLDGVQNLKLQALSLRGTVIAFTSFTYLHNHPSLTHLNVADILNCNGDCILSLIRGMKLNSLKLPDRHTTTDVGVSYLKDLPLLSIDLTNYINVTDNGISYLQNLTCLHHLHLSNTKLTDDGLKHLQGLCNLEVLYLDRTAITDRGAAVIKAFTKLKELDLASTLVTNKFLKEGVLNHCPMLTKLNLSRTQITVRGLCSLKLPHLCLLNLDGTALSKDPKPALQCCPQLKHISIRNLLPASIDEENDESY